MTRNSDATVGDAVQEALTQSHAAWMPMANHKLPVRCVVAEERLMLGTAGRVRLVAQGTDGFIYIGNDDGQLLRLRPAE